MEQLASAVLAALLGAASVSLFGRTWLALLGSLAAAILFFRGLLSGRRCLARMHGHLAKGFLCGLLLALAFRVHLHTLGLGTSNLEQICYFLGCLPVLLVFFRNAPGRIDDLFRTDAED